MQPIRNYTEIFTLCLAMLLGACAGQPPGKPTAGQQPSAAAVPAAKPSAAPASTVRRTVVATAHDMLGTPYRYGGTSPRGFDCSGLVWYSYRSAGIEVPRTTRRQYSAANRVPADALRSGDLLFFRIDGAKTDHVGIYIGDGRFIHAPSSGKKVSTSRLDNPYWRDRLRHTGNFF